MKAGDRQRQLSAEFPQDYCQPVRKEGVEPSRHYEHGFLRPAWLPVTPLAHGVDDGLRTRGLHLGKVTRYQLRHIRMEPAPRIELGPPPYRGGVLPLSPSRHSWRSSIRTRPPGAKYGRSAGSPRRPMEP